MNRDKKNSLWLALQYGISLILSLVGLKLNLLTFGASDFSIWILLLSIWGVGAVLDLGFGISIVRFIARKRADVHAVSNIASTGFLVFVVLGFAIVGLGIAVTELFYISNPALVPAGMVSVARGVQMLLAINFFNQYLSMFFRSVFEGHEEFIVPAKLALLSSIVLFLLITAAYILHLSLIYLSIFYFIASGCQTAGYFILLRRLFPIIHIHPRHARWNTFREIFSFSISVQVSYLVGALIDPVIKYLLGTYTQRTIIPPYEIARRFALAVSGLFSSSFRNTFPKASVLSTQDQYRGFMLKEGVFTARSGIQFSGILFGIFSFVFTTMIAGFYGFSEGVVVFFILAISESVNTTGFITYVVIVASGRASFLTFIQLINIGVVALCIVFGISVAGSRLVLLGYFVSVVVGNFAMLGFVRRMSGLPIKQFLMEIGSSKLAMFHGLALAAIFLIEEGLLPWYQIQIGFSSLCLIVFFRDLLLVVGEGRTFFKTHISVFFQ